MNNHKEISFQYSNASEHPHRQCSVFRAMTGYMRKNKRRKKTRQEPGRQTLLPILSQALALGLGDIARPDSVQSFPIQQDQIRSEGQINLFQSKIFGTCASGMASIHSFLWFNCGFHMVFVPGYAVANTLFCTEYVERAKRVRNTA